MGEAIKGAGVFDRTEFTRMLSERVRFSNITQHAHVKSYCDAFFRNDVTKSYLMGVGLDPVSTKPKILIATVADWAKAS
jgi:hypothetical protein